MKKLVVCLSFILILTFLVGCENGSSSDNPILLRGLIHGQVEGEELDSITYNFHSQNVSDVIASVKIIDTTKNETIASTEISGINHFPILYQIRKPFYEAYKNYWDDYKVEYEVRDGTSDVYKTSMPLDLYKYAYEVNVTVMLK